jgi:bifunctional non-homologous end joining protein LigD
MSCSASVTPLGFIKLEIPTPVPEPPTGAGWLHEIKYDGYRTLIVIDQGKVRAYSRPGRDWTGPYRRVVDACAKLPCNAALIDGEAIVHDENGISDFDTLRSEAGTPVNTAKGAEMRTGVASRLKSGPIHLRRSCATKSGSRVTHYNADVPPW